MRRKRRIGSQGMRRERGKEGRASDA